MRIDLNKNQKKAANKLNGNLLIIASAGTGKTTTIVERYKNFLEKKHLRPNEIMMTTFTNRAAKDMIKKITKLNQPISPYIGTMHSLFLKILRDNAEEAFNGKPYTIITDVAEQRKIVKEILVKNGIKSNYDAVQYFIRWIGKFKNRGIMAENLDWTGGIEEARKRGEITELLDDEIISVDPAWRGKVNLVYKKYQKYLYEHNFLDFDEILILTYKLFTNNPKILEIYKNQFKSIMVDEAQDLNVIQIKIIELLKKNNLCLIGDDCQNIYGWRGSSNDLIFNFQENEEQIYLEDNYRSNNEIIFGINKIISSMNNKIDKKLNSTRGRGNDINVKLFVHANHEIEWIVGEIEKLINLGESLEDIVVLFRTNRIGKTIEREFRKRRIPCHLARTVDFFNREEIKDILSFLKLKQNNYSKLDFGRLANLIKGFGTAKIEKICNFSEIKNISLIDASREEMGFPQIVKEKLNALIDTIESENYLDDFLEKFGYYNYLNYKYKNEGKKLEDKYENIESLLVLFKKHEGNLSSFLDSLIEVDKKEKTNNKIILSTIHGAKGLEWKHVYLIFCNERTLPFYKGELSNTKRDSELRLFYVAISRAKDNLTITSSKNEGYNWTKPSQFIEILEDENEFVNANEFMN